MTQNALPHLETCRDTGTLHFPEVGGSVPPFRTPVMLSLVTVSFNAAPSFVHTQNIRKYHDSLGKRLKIRVSNVSLEDR